MTEHVNIEQIDGSDLTTVEWWAAEVCRGVSVKDAADALHVESTRVAVVGALTDSLPPGVRERAAEICEGELLDDDISP
jgi:hypothetical protein